MENLIVTAAVVFLATLAANLLWAWLTHERSVDDISFSGKSRLRRPTSVVVLSGVIMLAMIIYVMHAISNGDMAAGTGAVAVVLTALTVLTVGRGLRR